MKYREIMKRGDHETPLYTSFDQNCLQTVSGQTLFSSLNDVVMYYSFKDVNLTQL